MSVTVSTFIEDCNKDLAGEHHIYPRHMAMYKNMVFAIDELLEADKVSTHKLKKSMKGLHNIHTANVQNEIAYAESMEKLGSVALSREAETGIGTAFLKLSVITKELANHRKIMCENFSNMVLFPINSLLKGDMNKIGDMKRPVDDAWKEYKSKGIKKEGRKKTTEIILYRMDPPQEQTAEDSERERRMFMYHTSNYLSKANDVKAKKGVELVQHLIDHYHAQLRYFNSGIELLEGMRSYFDGLADELQQRKLEKEDERKELTDIKNQLKTILQVVSKEGDKTTNRHSYKIHGQQGDKVYGGTKSGVLQKRSEGVRKQWQKRHCVIRNGMFTLAHNLQSAPTVTLPLLTCQVKPSLEKDKKLQFALVAHNRTYLFQAEDEADFEAWISVLSNAREDALNKAFGEGEGALSKEPVSSIQELTQGIISEVRRLPGNNQCVDCNAFDPTWLSTNLGVLVCIECSGIHRELGVHFSRIRSLTLDRLGTAELLLARAVGNSGFNEIMEANLDPTLKPKASSKMEQRKEFIQQKYVQKAFINPSGHQPNILLEDLRKAINFHDILAVLQLYADGVDFTAPMPDSTDNNTALHYCIEKEDLTSLHIVDFITQNCKNVNATNAVGNTALHLSAINNSSECAKLLVRNGAKMDAVNKDGKIPLKIAQEKNFAELIGLLQDDGTAGKFDHVKIDWGLHETEDIYATPLDLIDIKSDTKKENKASEAKKPIVPGASPPSPSLRPGQPAAPPPFATPGVIHRSVTSPKGMMKTRATPTPNAVTSVKTSNSRHSVALPHGYQVQPHNHNTQQGGEKQAPPLPPQRRTIKAKVPIPTPAVTTSATSTAPSTPPAINTSPTTAANSSETTVRLTSTSTPHLSTFAPKSVGRGNGPAASHAPSTTTSTAGEKGNVPPTPPTRSSSFIPRSSIDELLPRPDRPPPPVPLGHNRNKSDAGVFFTQELANSVDKRNRANSFTEFVNSSGSSDSPFNSSLHSEDPIPVDPDAPPLPPPRPKNKDDPHSPTALSSAINLSSSLGSSIPKRTSSISRKQQEPLKTKFRRAKALYDCEADHSDELTFVEGEIIVMKAEADPDWWYGEIEGDLSRQGVFPISFVHVLSD